MATLTYVYSDSTAVLGPLAVAAEPHSYDLCQLHASRLTAPRGWEVVRVSVPGNAVQGTYEQAPDTTNTLADESATNAGQQPVAPWRRPAPYDANVLGSSAPETAPTRRSLATYASTQSSDDAGEAAYRQRKIDISKPLTQPDDDWAAIADVVKAEDVADKTANPAASSPVPEGFIPPENLMRPRHAADPEPVQHGEVARRGHLRMLRDDT